MKQNNVLNLLWALVILGTGGCSLEETETCGPRLPEQTFNTIPPFEQFQTLEYNPEAGRLVLRWLAPDYESICTASNTQLGMTVDGAFERVRARIRFSGADPLFFELDPTGQRQWKALSPPIPLRNAFDNNPGKFSLSVYFQIEYRGSTSLQEQYDSLSSRFDRIRLSPVARYQ
ncbi:hypothetical protein GC167_03555 [bacterium]|nr:hypothetical protein [bacterium]